MGWCLLLDYHFTPTASTSNPSRFLAPFGLLPCLPQLQRPIRHAFLLLLDLCLLPRSFNVQSTTVSCSFWTSACFPAASTSNPSRFLTPSGLLPCLPQLQRPIRHAFLLLLDFCHASRSFNVQSVTLSCSFWTSAMPPTASTSNPSHFLAPFGLPHASRSFNIQSVTLSCSFWTSAMPPAALTSNPSRFLAPFGLPHASRSFNVQSDTLSCSFWTSACFPAASTSNPPRFLTPFGLLPTSPQLQRPIHHAFLLLLDFCLLSRRFNVQSTMHPSHTCLPTTTSSSQRKKATPAHQCQHCFISFNSLLIRLFNLITIPLFFSFP